MHTERDTHTEIKSDKVENKLKPDTTFAVLRTARRETPEALQGLRAKHLMYICEEASGIDERVFEVAHSSLATPGAKIILTSNPTRTSGYFYRAFDHRKKDSWWTKHVSFPDLLKEGHSWANPDYPKSVADEWGEDSNQYRVRVLGEFPTADEDSVIPLAWIEAAKTRHIEPSLGPVVWGVDVGEKGTDKCAVVKRRGSIVTEPPISWHGLELMQSTGRIVDMYETTKMVDRPVEIIVDSIGIGTGMRGRLAELGIPTIALNVSEKPSINSRYLRLKDELWWKAREWFGESNCKIPPHEALIKELSAMTYTYTSNGKLRVATKPEIRKKLGYSPDVADALILTMFMSERRGTALASRGRMRVPQTESHYNVHQW